MRGFRRMRWELESIVEGVSAAPVRRYVIDDVLWAFGLKLELRLWGLCRFGCGVTRCLSAGLVHALLAVVSIGLTMR